MTEDYLKQLTGNGKNEYPILGEGTTDADYNDAMWVLGRQKQSCPKTTTWKDLQLKDTSVDQKSIGMDDVDFDNIPLSQLSHGMHTVVNETRAAAEIKKAVSEVGKKRKSTYSSNTHRTSDKLEVARKGISDMWRDFSEDPRVTDKDINELYKRLEDGFREQAKVINKRCGKAGGGKRKMEMYGHQGGGW